MSCATCKWWEGTEKTESNYSICYNKHMQIGDPLGDKCKNKNCTKDIFAGGEGADVGKDAEDMEKIIDKVTESLWLETGRDFGCVHWEEK